MDEKLKKKEIETQNEYIARIYKNKVEYQLTNKMCMKAINKELNTQYAESTLRSIAYPFIEAYELASERLLSQNNNEDYLKELDEKKLEIEKLKLQYQDQKREYKNYLRADARLEHLKQEMIFEIQKLDEYKPLKVNKHLENSEKEAVLILSDWHTGIKESNYWNEVNIDILKNRIEYLQNKTIKICKLHNISTLNLEILGDMVNGLIHVTTRISNEEDVISQTMICSEILSNMIYNLSIYIPNIKIYSCIGNHGRCVANSTESLDTESFERMIPWYLKQRLNNINTVEFYDNFYDEGIIVYQFLNETIFAVHGHRDKPIRVINDLSQMLKKLPTEVHMGHYHSYYEKDEHDVSVVINGTASGIDKYAKNIRKTGSPNQTLMIYDKNGRECTYKIKI